MIIYNEELFNELDLDIIDVDAENLGIPEMVVSTHCGDCYKDGPIKGM